MMMIRWLCGCTWRDWIRNEDIRYKVRVASVMDKMRKVRLRWFGHVKRSSADSSVKTCERLDMLFYSVLGSSRREINPRDLIHGNGINDPISKNKAELLLLSLCVEAALSIIKIITLHEIFLLMLEMAFPSLKRFDAAGIFLL
ncbi:uncharacterized protein LOC132628306 [Lycium barbarum]|uniref:uncharacterized protein LOC132628306 n=1 Tax=Lycium barbarum TaxID=112863 RepID=UPI00293E903D|nr:uncharacterized protein LOC132628306 [Lycium barbarum]